MQNIMSSDMRVDTIHPEKLKQGNSKIHIEYGVHETPFGTCVIASLAGAIIALEFIMQTPEDTLDYLKQKWPVVHFREDNLQTLAFMNALFPSPDQTLKILLPGTEFQIRAWKALLNIPFVGVTTYTEIAKKIGCDKAVRAVGTAIGQNHLAFIVPCHRVLRKDGGLGGYKWGESRKRMMLEYENRSISSRSK